MTRAQAIFVVALSLVTVAIIAFGVYVASSTLWGRRWYPREHDHADVPGRGRRDQ